MKNENFGEKSCAVITIDCNDNISLDIDNFDEKVYDSHFFITPQSLDELSMFLRILIGEHKAITKVDGYDDK